jgi:peptidoglycan/LPS O-acetylase OafA/YrhL
VQVQQRPVSSFGTTYAPPAPRAPAPERRAFAFVDALRGVAALLVLFFHVQLHVVAGWPATPVVPGSLTDWVVLGRFDLGKFAVAVFFMISGFLIPSTLAAPGATLRRYATHRVFRLYPAYWLAIAVLVAADVLTGHAARLVPATLAVNLTMLQRFVGVPDAIGAFWTLQIEIVFYVACALLFVARALPIGRRALLAAGALALGSAVARGATGVALPVALFLALTLMCLGDRLRSAGRGAVRPRAVAVDAAIVAALLVPTCLLAYGDEGPRYLASYAAALATFLLAWHLRERFEGTAAPHRLLGWLGAVSYGVYLLQEPIGMRVASAVLAATDTAPLAHAAALASTLLAAHACYRLVELPCIRLGRRLVDGRSRAETPPLAKAA